MTGSTERDYNLVPAEAERRFRQLVLGKEEGSLMAGIVIGLVLGFIVIIAKNYHVCSNLIGSISKREGHSI